MNTNSHIKAGISMVNQNRQSEVEQKAQRIVDSIVAEQCFIANNEDEIKMNVEELKSLRESSHTVESIMGEHFPEGEEGTNSHTIHAVINKMSKAAQDEVAARAHNLSSAIAGLQKQNESSAATIEGLRKKLLELKSETITEQQILG